MSPCPSHSGPDEAANRSTTQFSRKARRQTAILAGGVLAAATLAAHATTILSTGFEPPDYTGGPEYDSGHQLTSQGWTNVLGALPNFDVYTYAGNQVRYTPSGAVPDIGGIPQLVTVPQNPTGGLHFTANGNQSGDQIAADFSLIASGLVEISIDYYPGDWFDNTGGNLNGGFTLRGPGNNGGVYTVRGSAQLPGDANGNGPWAPSWMVWNAANGPGVNGIPTAGLQVGHRYTEVTGFDNLARGHWHRLGMVYDKISGKITQLKTQELIPGGGIYIMNNPVGPASEDLYIQGGADTPLTNVGVRVYNVGNGTLSAYDNLYVGAPYTWQTVTDGPIPPFQITRIVRDPVSGEVTLTFPSESRSTYKVEASTDLATWEELDDNVAGQPMETDYLDDFFATDPAPGKDQAFYRVTRQP